MFSSKLQLNKRTPENGTDRESFLSLLVDEYINSSHDAKCQVLANLANFAYDPINYGYIRDVGVLDIFLHVLKRETNNKLIQFACSGICNLCLDQLNADYIVKNSSVKLIVDQLQNTNADIVLDSITTLFYLHNNIAITEYITPDVTKLLSGLKKSDDKRLANLAAIFLQDICGIN